MKGPRQGIPPARQFKVQACLGARAHGFGGQDGTDWTRTLSQLLPVFLPEGECLVNDPSVIVFDVNETLSDMSAMAAKFAETGAPASLAKLWFATLLRDGFALTAAGENPDFAQIGAETLRGLLPDAGITTGLEDAVVRIMEGMTSLGLHPDVAEAVRALKTDGYRLITLSNGSAQLAEKMFTPAGILDEFEAFLSVEQASAWKPNHAAYAYAAGACGTSPNRMLLVAVHPWDIHGAARAGLQTAWINRAGAAYPSHFTAPDHTVTVLTELSGVLRMPTR